MSQWPTRRWIIGPIVVVAVSAWVAAAAFQTVRSFGSQQEVMDTKLSEAERVLYYRMSHGQGPSIQLSGTEEALVLITHLVLPPAAEYDPTRRIRYGIQLQIFAGDKLVWERPIYTQTRQSKDKELFDNVWRYENSFLRDSDDQVSDDRLFIVYLPPGVPTDAVLKVTLLCEGASQGLIRFYNRVRQSSLEQQVALRSLSAKDRRAEVWSNTFEPWSMLPRREQQSRLRYGTERLSALGEHGIDYDTVVVYYTGFRLPLEVLELDQAIKVDRHRFAAINLVGPTQLTIEVARDDGEGGARPETSSSGDAAVEISSVSDGYVEPMPGTLVPVGSRVEISVPAGLHSMRLTTRSSERFAVRALGPKNATFGAPVGIGEDQGRLRPDEIRIPVLMSDSSDISLPIQVAGVGEPDPLSRLLRIEVRWLEPDVPAGIVARSSTFLAQDPASDQSVESSAERPIVGAASPKSKDQSGTDAAAAFAGSLQVTFLDRDGKPVGQTARACGDARAPYEWLDRSGFAPVGLSEPVNVQLIVPKGISQLQLRTTRPAAVRLFRYLPNEQIYELPYREAVLSEEINWRYARIEKRVWWPMRPINHQELAKSEQLTTLVAQARLEPRWSGDSSDPRTRRPATSVVVDPLGNPERHLIIEPLPAERAREARASWGGGMVAALPRGRDEGFRWSEDMHQRARIHYWLEPREVGAEVRVIIDGAAAGTFVARAAQGSWELLPLPPGEHQVRVETDAGSIELFLDRPPLSPGIALHRQRTVFAMGRAPLRLRVTRRMRQRSVLHAVVYGPWKESRPDVGVRVLVSGGRPNRIEGQPVTTITKADRRQPLPPAMVEQQAIFTDRQSGKAGYPRLISTVLGDDIAAGTHLVDIYSVYGQQLWVRFFITNYQIDQEEGALQWRFRDVP